VLRAVPHSARHDLILTLKSTGLRESIRLVGQRIDAFAHLRKLMGQPIHTLTQGKENTVLGFDGPTVLVATAKAPWGEPVEVADVQAALDRLSAGEEVEVTVESLGHRSAFVGAMLAQVPGAVVSKTRPRKVRIA